MGKVMNKFKDIMGWNDELDEYEDYLEIEEGAEKEVPPTETNSSVSQNKKNNNKVLNIHSTSSTKILIVKPTVFEDATEICDYLKSRKIVVINTANLDIKIAQRLLDFVAGVSLALGGELQEVERTVFILSPSNVEVSSDLKNELSSKGLFNWTKKLKIKRKIQKKYYFICKI